MADVTITGGVIKVGDHIVGEVADNTIELNLSWLRLAGAGLIVHGDKHDPRRVVLNRPAGGRKAEKTESEPETI